MTLRALIFDFGDVLDALDDKVWWLTQRDTVASRIGMTGDDLWAYLYNNPLWEQLKRGKIDPDAYWDGTLRPKGLTDKAAQQAFVDQLYKDRDQINPAMVALLRELKPRYKLGMLSNTFRLELENWLIEVHGLDGIFDVVVGSADVGLAKPEPEIYQLTLTRLGVAPDEALFIDDLVRNTKAAENLGIGSILFESSKQLRQELKKLGVLE